MRIQEIGKSTCFAVCVDLLVIANLAIVGCEVEFGDKAVSIFDLLHVAFAVVYLIELVFRLAAYGKKFFMDVHNWFDVLIIFLALVDVIQSGGNTWLWRFTMFRAVRLLRVWKVAKSSPPLIDLWLVIVGLTRALRALAWLAIILSIVAYACGGAITGMVKGTSTTKCTGKPGMYCLDVDEYFGSVSRSMFTLFQLMTRSQWASHVVRPLSLISPLAAFLCVVFVAATSYGLLSVAVGVLVYSTVELARKHEDHGLHRSETEDKEIINDLASYFRASLAIEERTGLDRRELEEAMSVPQISAAFKHLELPVGNVDELFSHLDRDKSGSITVEEFEAGGGIFTNMAHLRKIQKDAPDALEISVAQALADLEVSLTDLRADLAPLKIMSAREIDVTTNKKAIIIMVPFIQLAQFRKIQTKLVRELEKKFSGRHVVFIANRRILKKPAKNNTVKRQKRPFSRTVTAVHTAILEDLTFPVEIVKKRTRVRADTTKLLKVFLDPKEQQHVETKVDTFAAVYKRLTGKEIAFEFPTDM